MATKREIREQNELNTNPEKELEDTMQLDTEEVRKADEDGIQIPDFANTFYDERPYSEKLRPEHEKKRARGRKAFQKADHRRRGCVPVMSDCKFRHDCRKEE